MSSVRLALDGLVFIDSLRFGKLYGNASVSHNRRGIYHGVIAYLYRFLAEAE